MRLEAASTDMPHGLAELIADLGRGENGFGGTPVATGEQSLEEYLQRCIGMTDPAQLRPGYVPQTVFWAIDENGEAIGMARVRHYLNDRLREQGGHIGYYIRRDQRRKGYGREILRQALIELRRMGETRALITVYMDNIASIRVIEANGGVFESEGQGADGHRLGRYWIELHKGNEGSLYSDARRYDLVMGAYASEAMFDFYLRQVSRYGEPVLVLACGSGRLTIPLARAGVQVTGMDLSGEMLSLACIKAAEAGVSVRLLPGDMRSFSLGEQFKLILVPAQSLCHLHTLQELEDCFACVQRHLAPDGRFVIELFNSSVRMLAREPQRRYEVGQYEDPRDGSRIVLTEQVRYDAASQINHLRWFFREEGIQEETMLSFEMRQFFPQEIDALLGHNGFIIEHKYGSYDEREFSSESPKQLIVCRVK